MYAGLDPGREHRLTNHRGTLSLSPVYHVGNLDGERRRPYTSNEGRELSISVHPIAWRNILIENGHSTLSELTTYELTKEDSRFYFIDPTKPLDVEREWCVENNLVKEVTGYRVEYEDALGAKSRIEFYSKRKAKTEAEMREGSLTPVKTVRLDYKGRQYWKDAFMQHPDKADPIHVEGILPIWYAAAHGFDGVWWDEIFDPMNHSCPRGLIFQDKLDCWDVDEIEIY